jgi:hypothetical protein
MLSGQRAVPAASDGVIDRLFAGGDTIVGTYLKAAAPSEGLVPRKRALPLPGRPLNGVWRHHLPVKLDKWMRITGQESSHAEYRSQDTIWPSSKYLHVPPLRIPVSERAGYDALNTIISIPV